MVAKDGPGDPATLANLTISADEVIKRSKNGAQLATETEATTGGLSLATLVDYLFRAADAYPGGIFPARVWDGERHGTNTPLVAFDEQLVEKVVAALGQLAMRQRESQIAARTAPVASTAASHGPHGVPGTSATAGNPYSLGPRGGSQQFQYAGGLHVERTPVTAAGGRYIRELLDCHAVQAIATVLAVFVRYRNVVLSACWALEALCTASYEARRILLRDPQCAGYAMHHQGSRASRADTELGGPRASEASRGDSRAATKEEATGIDINLSGQGLVLQNARTRKVKPEEAGAGDSGPARSVQDLLHDVQVVYSVAVADSYRDARKARAKEKADKAQAAALTQVTEAATGARSAVESKGSCDDAQDADADEAEPAAPVADVAVMIATSAIHHLVAMLKLPTTCDPCTRLCTTGAGLSAPYVAWLVGQREGRRRRGMIGGRRPSTSPPVVPIDCPYRHDPTGAQKGGTDAAADSHAGSSEELAGDGDGVGGSGSRVYQGRRGSTSSTTGGKRLIVFNLKPKEEAREMVAPAAR